MLTANEMLQRQKYPSQLWTLIATRHFPPSRCRRLTDCSPLLGNILRKPSRWTSRCENPRRPAVCQGFRSAALSVTSNHVHHFSPLSSSFRCSFLTLRSHRKQTELLSRDRLMSNSHDQPIADERPSVEHKVSPRGGKRNCRQTTCLLYANGNK